jgi:L-glutamine-phosphate cytidylyltransferase
MKALISAGGLGKRMNLGEDKNKTLLQIGDKTILEHTVTSLRGCGVNDISIIVGYQADSVRTTIGKSVTYFDHKDYLNTGLIASILHARDYLYGEAFLLIMGDLFFDPKILPLAISAEGDIVVTYDVKDNYVPEDSKAVVSDGKVDFMGKDIPPHETSGEFGHLIKFSKEGSRIFFDEIENFTTSGRSNSYLMDVINEIISRHIIVHALNITGYPRIEIDFQEDYIEAVEKVLPMIHKGA